MGPPAASCRSQDAHFTLWSAFLFCSRFWFGFIFVQHSQRRDAAPKTRVSLCGVRFFFARVFSKANRRSKNCGDFSFVYLTGTLFAGAPVFFVCSGPGMEGFFLPRHFSSGIQLFFRNNRFQKPGSDFASFHGRIASRHRHRWVKPGAGSSPGRYSNFSPFFSSQQK